MQNEKEDSMTSLSPINEQEDSSEAVNNFKAFQALDDSGEAFDDSQPLEADADVSFQAKSSFDGQEINDKVEPVEDNDPEPQEEPPIVPEPPEIIPPPPPPPPPPLRSSPPLSLHPAEKVEIRQAPKKGEIPQAPKLTNLGPTAAETKRKGMVAPNGLSARYVFFNVTIPLGSIVSL